MADRHVRPVVAALAFGCLLASPLRSQEIDTARALSGLRDAMAMCRADAGALWHHDLCGPLALAPRHTDGRTSIGARPSEKLRNGAVSRSIRTALHRNEADLETNKSSGFYEGTEIAVDQFVAHVIAMK
jgi:hypothetical protein